FEAPPIAVAVPAVSAVAVGADESTSAAATVSSGFDVAADRTAKRILLVDDTSFFREIVKRYLSNDKLEIMTGVDGRHGLELLANNEFDLVLSDIEMPNMDGWQFCKAAREK